MSKLFVIISREYREIVHKKSFFVGILLTPVLIFAWSVLPSLLFMKSAIPTQKIVIVEFGEPVVAQQAAARLAEVRNNDEEFLFVVKGVEHYTSLQDLAWIRRKIHLNDLVQQDSLNAVLLFHDGVVHSDSLTAIAKTLDVKAIARCEKTIGDVLATYRIEASGIAIPVDSLKGLTRSVDLYVVSPSGKAKSFRSAFFSMMILASVILIMVLGFGQLLMRAIIEEKTSRIMEVVISSVSPFQMMMGKMLGMGAAAMTQMASWVVLGFGARMFMGSAFDTPEVQGAIAGVINPIFLFYFFAYLAISFFMFTAMFATVGAICNTDKEAQNLVAPLTFMLITPFMIGMSMLGTPGAWVIALSFVPFFTPSLMVMRLSMAAPEHFSLSDPVLLQATIGLVTTTLFTLGIIWVTAKIFRVGILMYGKRPTVPEILRWVKSR